MVLDLLFKLVLGILGLSIIVLIHEAGHFIAARCTGIGVETFSIGFGKRLFGFRRGVTDYRISMIPLGGYCRFFGEESFRAALDEKLSAIPLKKGEFYASPPWKRLIVSASGPLANLIFAILVYTAIAWSGFQEQYTDPRIILASEYSENNEIWPADEAGLQTGDYIISVDGKPVNSFQDLRKYLVFQPEKTVALSVERNGQALQLTVVPSLDKKNSRAIIGILGWQDTILDSVSPGSAADMAGFLPGDRIIAIDNVPIDHTVDFTYTIKNRKNIVSTTVLRNGRKVELQWDMGNAVSDSDTGFSFAVPVRHFKKGPFLSLVWGLTETWRTFSATLDGLRMITMGIRLRNAVVGPIRLVSSTGAYVAQGFQEGGKSGLLSAFELLALISISLAFLNLLPIPILDGGQILLFCVEYILRRPLKPQFIYRYQFVGTIIVLAITIFATTGDILSFRGQ